MAPVVSGDSRLCCLFPQRIFLEEDGPCTSQVAFYTHPTPVLAELLSSLLCWGYWAAAVDLGLWSQQPSRSSGGSSDYRGGTGGPQETMGCGHGRDWAFVGSRGGRGTESRPTFRCVHHYTYTVFLLWPHQEVAMADCAQGWKLIRPGMSTDPGLSTCKLLSLL